MSIDEQDLKFVRQVLTGKIGLDQLVTSYSVREAAITAVVILRAVGRTTFAKRRDYEKLLNTVCVQSGLPTDEHGFDLIPIQDLKFHSYSLVEKTRKLGLYKSSGSVGRGELIAHPLIETFLQQTGLQQRAQQLYDAAHEKFQADKAAREAYHAKARKVWDALRSLQRVSITSSGTTFYGWTTFGEFRKDLERAIAIIDSQFPRK